MKAENNREDCLFREALKRATGPERQAFLDGACMGDQALRARLEALLLAHENPFSEFLTLKGNKVFGTENIRFFGLQYTGPL